MGYGPVLTMPVDLYQALPGMCRAAGVHGEAQHVDPGQVQVHLVCASGWNPLLWAAEMRLLGRAFRSA